MTTPPRSIQEALTYVESHLDQTLDSLKELARIPGISANKPPDPDVQASAKAVAAWAERAGLENVEVLQLDGVHPYVYADWLHAADAPTVLLYAHHDVQPPGQVAGWTSPPFEPEIRDGRLYGRGVVDDKAGAAIHFAAIEAYLRNGGLPLNLRLVVDGEEELGSEHLSEFLSTFRDRLRADALVLTDTANLAAGLPSITVGLRGIVVVDLEVQAIDHPLHSGIFGGPVPDATLALCKLLARLTDDDGRLAIDGAYDAVRPLSEQQRAAIRDLPFDEQEFRKAAGVLDGVALAGEPGCTVYEMMWHRPAVAISALEAAPLEGAPNQIVPSARARIGIRTVPDMDERKVAEDLCRFLAADPPWGVKVRTRIQATGGSWAASPDGPVFEAAARALQAGFGTAPVHIGCGGSIPFVEPFAAALGGVPAVLIGLEDPECNAHGLDESLLLSDFVKSLKSAVHLYAELAASTPKR
ncbi:MAG: M20/M25/M40 family metallo-hydrolase [Deltaproteobacteria bacterium]|jgi:acetylornithine deacetylase/succinyl-diaminopimelate desuccinylase-like protein|nr:M20/M25/M40 family metallo-hydrolase [Deltaproteobacteria bacterium]MBW2536489.1 M20/M25/M40 family metallo-hydrolase [Deltaproteobacteria bacterium]